MCSAKKGMFVTKSLQPSWAEIGLHSGWPEFELPVSTTKCNSPPSFTTLPKTLNSNVADVTTVADHRPFLIAKWDVVQWSTEILKCNSAQIKEANKPPQPLRQTFLLYFMYEQHEESSFVRYGSAGAPCNILMDNPSTCQY